MPGKQKKVQLANTPLPEAYPGQSGGWVGGANIPQQVDKFVPPGPSASINPAGNVPGPTNRSNSNGHFSPFNSSPQGNFPGFVGTIPSGTGNLSRGRAPGNPSPGNGWSPKKKKRLPVWGRIAIGLLVFLIIVTGGCFAYYETQIAPSLNNILGKSATHRTDTQDNTGSVPTGRTNILLLGSDTDGKGNDPTNGIPLAQTVMIITVDPQTNYVGMLSIPRDMQVTEKGYFEPKLDEVFSHGYSGNTLQDKVAAGAGEMEDIIQRNFGIHIDHYAWVGLDGFVKVINTAGGVDVDTIHPMVDDTYPDDVGNTNGSIYDYKRLYIAPGPQHLNGVQALEYVRTRHSDLIGDFGRTIRQQQVINQLKVKLATPDSIGKASELVRDLNGAVQTDMQLNDVIALGNLARGIDTNSVQRLTLGPPDYAVPNLDGARTSNYLPRCENIVPAIQKMFNVRSPRCVSQASSNSSSIASTTPSTMPTAFNTVIASEPKQGSASNDAFKNNTATSMEGASLYAGVHGLLDLLFATTFESFDAMQV
jgi:LCP family protein required for cell wall assembly